MLQTIDLDSFNSIWFWAVVLYLWSQAGSRILGVPWDVIQTMRDDPPPELIRHIRATTDMYAARYVGLDARHGWIIWALWAFVISSALMLGFGYGYLLAQAVFLISLPLAIIWGVTLRLAHRVRGTLIENHRLFDVLRRHRLWLRVIAIMALVFTSLWGGLQSVLLSMGVI